MIIVTSPLFSQSANYKDCEWMPKLLESAYDGFEKFRGNEIKENKPIQSKQPYDLKMSIPLADEAYLDFGANSWDCEIKYRFTNEADMIARKSQFEKNLERCLKLYVKEKRGDNIHFKHKDFAGSTGVITGTKDPVIWSFSGGSGSRFYFNVTIKAPALTEIAKTDVSVGRHNFKRENGFAVVWIEEDSSVNGLYYEGFPEKRQIIGATKDGKYYYQWGDIQYEIQGNNDSLLLKGQHPKYGEVIEYGVHTKVLKEKENQHNYLVGYTTSGKTGFTVYVYRDTIVVDRFLLGQFKGRVEDNDHIQMTGADDLYYLLVEDELWINRNRDWLNPTVFRKED